MLAGERSPSKEPVMVSLAPESTAVADPMPASEGRVRASAGTADSRALYVSPVCAGRVTASPEIQFRPPQPRRADQMPLFPRMNP